MTRGLLALALLALASCRDESSAEPRVNSCTQDFECAAADSCHPQLRRCFRERADYGYSYVVQVVTDGNGRGLVPRTLDVRRMLTESVELEPPIRIRNAVRVRGQVTDKPEGGAALEAEVAFLPQTGPAYLTPPLSTFTRSENGQPWFTAYLDPATNYEVRVLPLGKQTSARFPPRTFPPTALQLDEGANEIPPLAYPALEELQGRLLPETPTPRGATSKLAGLRVRLRNKAKLETASSVTSLAADGEYRLFVEKAVFDNLAAHELVVDLLRTGPRWVATLAIDGARLQPEMTIPNIPELARVEVALEAEGSARPSADLAFVSTFVPPKSDPTVTLGRDWCRLRAQSSAMFTCRAQFWYQVEGREKTEVQLLPGHYDIFVAPNAGIENRQRLATTATSDNVFPQPPDKVTGPIGVSLRPANSYRGKVVSPRGETMSQVTVTANALNLPDRSSSNGELAAYNRTSAAISDGKGAYELAVDVGSYDLIAAAPEGSGFPWYCYPNRFVSNDDRGDFNIPMRSPVIARGRVIDEQGRPVFPARVEAFAIVEDQDGERALRIARSESNDAGVFVLYMPPRIEDDRIAPTSMDGGVSIDAGVQRLPLSDGGQSAAPR